MQSSASASSLASWVSRSGFTSPVAIDSLSKAERKDWTWPANSVSLWRFAEDRHGVSSSSMTAPPVCGSSASVCAAWSRPCSVRVSVIPGNFMEALAALVCLADDAQEFGEEIEYAILFLELEWLGDP